MPILQIKGVNVNRKYSCDFYIKEELARSNIIRKPRFDQKNPSLLNFCREKTNKENPYEFESDRIPHEESRASEVTSSNIMYQNTYAHGKQPEDTADHPDKNVLALVELKNHQGTRKITRDQKKDFITIESFLGETIVMNKKLESRNKMTVEKSDENDRKWLNMFEQLKLYKLEHGDCLVPSDYLPNRRLSRWVKQQRYFYHKSQSSNSFCMSEKRRDMLTGLGFEWSCHDLAWNQRFEELKMYKKKNGHCLVPARYGANPKLGRWVNNQRVRYHSNKSGNRGELLNERVKKLESIGFSWNA